MCQRTKNTNKFGIRTQFRESVYRQQQLYRLPGTANAVYETPLPMIRNIYQARNSAGALQIAGQRSEVEINFDFREQVASQRVSRSRSINAGFTYAKNFENVDMVQRYSCSTSRLNRPRRLRCFDRSAWNPDVYLASPEIDRPWSSSLAPFRFPFRLCRPGFLAWLYGGSKRSARQNRFCLCVFSMDSVSLQYYSW